MAGPLPVQQPTQVEGGGTAAAVELHGYNYTFRSTTAWLSIDLHCDGFVLLRNCCFLASSITPWSTTEGSMVSSKQPGNGPSNQVRLRPNTASCSILHNNKINTICYKFCVVGGLSDY